jgi:hypothetical protein
MKKLKFELVNGYGVLVDREVKIDKDDFYISWEDSYTTPKWVIYCKSTGLNGKNPMKIIFAEKELGLDVPIFEWRDFEVENNPNIHDWVQEVILKEGKYWNDQDALEPVYYGIIKGYKSNPAKYTEEDLRKAIEMARDYPADVVGYQKDEIIQSLQKYPKYVVMEMKVVNDFGEPYSFDDMDFGVEREYRPKLFTNSDGKSQGTVKELIWT